MRLIWEKNWQVSGWRVRLFKFTSPPVMKIKYGCLFVRWYWKKYGIVSGSRIWVLISVDIFKYDKISGGRTRVFGIKQIFKCGRISGSLIRIIDSRRIFNSTAPNGDGHRIWNKYINCRDSRLREISVLIDLWPVPHVMSGTVSGFRAEKKCSTVQYIIRQLHKGVVNIFNPSPVKNCLSDWLVSDRCAAVCWQWWIFLTKIQTRSEARLGSGSYAWA